MNDPIEISCPAPLADPALITMAHGGGGRMMHQLIERVFIDAFRNPFIERRHDGAALPNDGAELVMTTDSYVVRPRFFPAATSVRSRSTARSTTWPCAGRGRCG